MYYIRLLIVLMLICVTNLTAQNTLSGLGESAFSVNHNVTPNYKINFSAKSRYFIFEDNTITLKKRQLDVVHFSTYSLNYNHSVSLGVQYRFRDVFDGGNNEFRLTQQFNYTKKRLALRFGHRFRLEQRILSHKTILRKRYRFALDTPLNGEKADIGEAYLITALEALLSTENTSKPELDQRITAQIGWRISKQLKIQAGLEYRFEAYNLNTEQLLFILTTAVLQL